MCRVDPRTVERWTAQGRLRRIVLAPKTVRYRADDIAELLTPTDGSPAVEARLPETSTGLDPAMGKSNPRAPRRPPARCWRAVGVALAELVGVQVEAPGRGCVPPWRPCRAESRPHAAAREVVR